MGGKREKNSGGREEGKEGGGKLGRRRRGIGMRGKVEEVREREEEEEGSREVEKRIGRSKDDMKKRVK